MNLSVAAAAVVFLLSPTAQWAGDKVVNYKIAELKEMPEVQEAGYDSWERVQVDQDVLRVNGFYMKHELVDLQTQSIEVPLFHDWLRIGQSRAEMPNRDMVWTFEQLDADFSSEQNGQLLAAQVSDLTYRGAPFEFEVTGEPQIDGLYAMVAEQFASGDLGDMQVSLQDMGDHLELIIGWQQDGVFSLQFSVQADLSYREFRREGYESELWSRHVTRPVQVRMSQGGETIHQFGIDWARRPSVFEPLIELVLREVPNTLESLKG